MPLSWDQFHQNWFALEVNTQMLNLFYKSQNPVIWELSKDTMAKICIPSPVWDSVTPTNQELLFTLLIIYYTGNELWGLRSLCLQGDIPGIVIRLSTHWEELSM